MKILLDTSAYSVHLLGHEEIGRALQEASEVCLNPIVIGELVAGFTKGTQSKRNQKILGEFQESYRVRSLGIDDETADRYGVILNSLWKLGSPIPTNDIWIAASAMQHGLRILTTDRHFLKVAQVMVDHFESSS